ncbi:hypothetical protein Pyn_31476 [Prunus yedoensis var. nudiflora]|uniref:non-specific serine/threonine protein kinase n=1 Tax=Prunus yedoensis var. nudiflora TaxID=2094558 RepID=A0A314U7Y2_PRUYE|nr:hypothetical protein Pyn_31476 [Prunus yedoensis var. nudiflora]
MEVNKKCDVFSFGVVTLEVIMGSHPGDVFSSLSSGASSSSSSASPSPEMPISDVLDPAHLATLKSRSRGGGVSCEDSICILESQSAVSSNNEESFSAPLINSEAAFVKAIAYDNMW